MVHASEADVLIRQMPQLVDRGIDLDAPGGDGVQQCAQALLFDGNGSLWCACFMIARRSSTPLTPSRCNDGTTRAYHSTTADGMLFRRQHPKLGGCVNKQHLQYCSS